MFKVIVAGSRTFNDYNFLKEKLDFLLDGYASETIEIVYGGAAGADSLAWEYAKEKNLAAMCFTADWDKHGKAAGPLRNKRMAEYADACVVFIINNSRGSQSMIKEAKLAGLKLIVYDIKQV